MERRFRHLLDEHGNRAFQLASLLLGQRQEAEDVVQDMFIKLWQQLGRLRPGEEQAWLLACVRNACLDRLRARSRRRRLLRLVPEREAAETPDGRLLDRQRRELLRCMLQTLPEPGRSLLILRDVQDTDVATTAAILDLTPGQVKVYTFRARRNLRHLMEERLNEQAA